MPVARHTPWIDNPTRAHQHTSITSKLTTSAHASGWSVRRIALALNMRILATVFFSTRLPSWTHGHSAKSLCGASITGSGTYTSPVLNEGDDLDPDDRHMSPLSLFSQTVAITADPAALTRQPRSHRRARPQNNGRQRAIYRSSIKGRAGKNRERRFRHRPCRAIGGTGGLGCKGDIWSALPHRHPRPSPAKGRQHPHRDDPSFAACELPGVPPCTAWRTPCWLPFDAYSPADAFNALIRNSFPCKSLFCLAFRVLAGQRGGPLPAAR